MQFYLTPINDNQRIKAKGMPHEKPGYGEIFRSRHSPA